MATYRTFDIGAEVRLTENFRVQATGVLTDPSEITLMLDPPNGLARRTYVYGDDVELARDEAGVYHLDLIIQPGEVGRWEVRWAGTGTINAADEPEFRVRPSRFV